MDQTYMRKKKKSWEYEDALVGKDLNIMEIKRIEEEDDKKEI